MSLLEEIRNTPSLTDISQRDLDEIVFDRGWRSISAILQTFLIFAARKRMDHSLLHCSKHFLLRLEGFTQSFLVAEINFLEVVMLLDRTITKQQKPIAGAF